MPAPEVPSVVRVRAALIAVVVVALSLSGAVVASAAVVVGPDGGAPAAAVAWSPSTALVISEVQTGGASASDEFVELENAGTTPVDLAGLEVVYVTSTGGTITRKATWSTSRVLDVGRHLLLANVSGVFASLADATYSGGLAATGGSVVLRPVGGSPIDAVGWGDATNAYVEGAAAAAAPAGSSIERLPGGAAGNAVDTNVNAADLFVQAAPSPQDLAAAPVPVPTASPSPTATPAISPTPAATATPVPTPSLTGSPMPSLEPTPAATDAPTPGPTDTAAPTASVEPTSAPTEAPSASPAPTPQPSAPPSPTAVPSPTAAPSPAPSLIATPEPTLPTPTATPAPSVLPILDARSLPDGATATIEGVLTTALGALESGHTGFIQDASAGIAVYLGEVPPTSQPAGTVVRITGTLDQRYAERTLRAQPVNVEVLGYAALPAPINVSSGAVGEYVEGSRVAVEGLTVGSPTSYADGLGLLVDDGTGPVRVIVAPDAAVPDPLPAGTHVAVVGPVGQRDSSGTGLSGYRVFATLPGELLVLPPTPTPEPTATPAPTIEPTLAPSPTPLASPDPTVPPAATASPAPTATPAPTAPPSPTPSASPTPTPTPLPSPTPPPSATSIAVVRALPAGTRVSVSGVVTAEAGRLGTPSLFAIGDPTGGIAVRLPDGASPPARGTLVSIDGPLADPYGQLEIRPDPIGLRIVGASIVPVPLSVAAIDLGEVTEGRLVELVGTARTAPTRATSGDIAADLVDANGRTFRVMADASSGVTAARIPVGTPLRVTGIVGQRASRKGALDGYRVWLRDANDVRAEAATGPSLPTPGPGSGSVIGASSSDAPPSRIASLRGIPDGTAATIEGVVTTTAGLLDADGRRIVVQDGSAGLEIVLPAGVVAPAVGARIVARGVLAHAWAAPRLVAASLVVTGTGATIVPVDLETGPGSDEEWLLARIRGEIVHVERIGERWRAEVTVRGERLLVSGLASARIPASAIVAGRAATFVGIVRRPYPTATDRRYAIEPRGAYDVAIAAAAAAPRSLRSSTTSRSTSPTEAGPSMDVTPDADVATLEGLVGRSVRIGGIVVAVSAPFVTIDDGTGLGRVLFAGDAATLLSGLRTGDPLSLRGRVVERDGEIVVEVRDASAVARVGSLGEALPVLAAARASASSEHLAGVATRSAGLALDPASGPATILVALGSVPLGVAWLRRRSSRRRLAEVVAERLASLGQGDGGVSRA